MRKRLVNLIILIVGLILVVNLSRDIFRLLRAADQLKLAEAKLEKLVKKNQELKRLNEYYQSDEFIEEEARNRLNMARPGETVVVLPPRVKKWAKQARGEGKPEGPLPKPPNWKRWWQLYFGNTRFAL